MTGQLDGLANSMYLLYDYLSPHNTRSNAFHHIVHPIIIISHKNEKTDKKRSQRKITPG